jgi:Domain of unknown function (DUF4878)
MVKGVTMRKVMVLACILSLLLSAGMLAGCGSGGSSGSNSPEGVAQAFWLASLKGDAAASWAMLSKVVQGNLKNESVWAQSVVSSNPTATVTVGKATVTGDRAKVSVKIAAGGTVITTQTVSLVKENGVWKVEMP